MQMSFSLYPLLFYCFTNYRLSVPNGFTFFQLYLKNYNFEFIFIVAHPGRNVVLANWQTNFSMCHVINSTLSTSHFIKNTPLDH